MKTDLFIESALFPAFRLLPVAMGSPAAMAMCVAIALQESKLTYRHQINGPAHGYFQFERNGGVHGVLTHHSTRPHAVQICEDLDITPTGDEVYAAIEFHDVLACAFARLLLWSLPQAMPPQDDPDAGWKAYIDAWRPGKPHPDTWRANFDIGWLAVADATMF